MNKGLKRLFINLDLTLVLIICIDIHFSHQLKIKHEYLISSANDNHITIYRTRSELYSFIVHNNHI